MKLKYMAYLLVILNFVIFGCVQRQPASMENMEAENSRDLEFKKMCQESGYEWMLMKPTKDGKIIHEAESCWGCMIESIEHVCDMEKLNEFMEK